MDTIIEFDNVTFAYPAYRGTEDKSEPSLQDPVLHNVSLRIGRGEMVAVLGHNGSGKSTLAKMTNGILLPDDGRVLVAGMDTRDEAKIWEVRQTAGLVFQNPDNQIVATVVEEDVAFALENLGVPPDEIRERVDGALRTVGMYDYREHAPHRLSGGQKQRIAIAGVLAMNPDMLVLDEPTAMLDPKGRREVMDTIIRLCREHGVTILMVTHHMNEAALCDRAIVMDRGRIRLDDAPRHVFAQYDLLKELNLTVPQTVELCRMLGIDGAAPLTVEECADVIYAEVNKSAGSS